jgi:AcrR family transcriptional regulator
MPENVNSVVDIVADAMGAGSGPDPAPGHRRPGRPRSERAERAIIEAALALFAECGVDALCIEKVAARAGVGKATIYLLIDALASLKTPLPEPRGRSAREDLIALLQAMSADTADPRRTREFALLMGEGQKYPRLMARYEETVVEPRRDVFRQVLRRGAATGQLRADIDVDAALFMLVGAVMIRGRYEPEVISPEYAERVVDELLRGLAAR